MLDRSPIAVLPGLATEAAAPESYRRSHLARGDAYDANLASSPFDDYLSRAEAHYLGRLLGTVLPARINRYLDFACGTGRITRQLESRADESFGVDISPSMLRIARTRCRFTEFVHADLTDFARQTHELSGFDVVTAFRFFGNAEPALRRLAGTLLAVVLPVAVLGVLAVDVVVPVVLGPAYVDATAAFPLALAAVVLSPLAALTLQAAALRLRPEATLGSATAGAVAFVLVTVTAAPLWGAAGAVGAMLAGTATATVAGTLALPGCTGWRLPLASLAGAAVVAGWGVFG